MYLVLDGSPRTLHLQPSYAVTCGPSRQPNEEWRVMGILLVEIVQISALGTQDDPQVDDCRTSSPSACDVAQAPRFYRRMAKRRASRPLQPFIDRHGGSNKAAMVHWPYTRNGAEADPIRFPASDCRHRLALISAPRGVLHCTPTSSHSCLPSGFITLEGITSSMYMSHHSSLR